MFESLLVANRGEIARRVLRTASTMGLRTIAVHSDLDASLPYVREADEAVLLGPASAAEASVAIERLLEAARRTGAQAIHPGYGQIATSPAFAQAVLAAGLGWVGPPPEVMASAAAIVEGGRPELPAARRIEVDILGLPSGRIVVLGEHAGLADATKSVLLEEAPVLELSDELRGRLLTAALEHGEAVGYRNAGNVCFLVDQVAATFEVTGLTAALPVHHPLVEQRTGIDLVEEQLRIAAGDEPAADLTAMARSGHAIELAVSAEQPAVHPSDQPLGTLSVWREPTGEGVRVDAGYGEGDVVSGHYDPLLAKLCAWGPERDVALHRARQAIAEFRIEGVGTNLATLAALLDGLSPGSGGDDAGRFGRMQG